MMHSPVTLETTVKLSEPMLRAACDIARDRDQTVGQFLRDALAAEIRRGRKRKGPSAGYSCDQILGPNGGQVWQADPAEPEGVIDF